MESTIRPDLEKKMARGQQKIQAQQKRAEKLAKSKKKDKGGKSSMPASKQATCLICRQVIQQLGKDKVKAQAKLQIHIDSKHKKLSMSQCFPCFTTEAINEAASAEKNQEKSKYKPDKEKKEKKKKYKRKGV